MRKIVTGLFVVSFVAIETALFYAGHLGLNLADMTANERAIVQAKINVWYASLDPAAYRRHVAKHVEDARQRFASLLPAQTGETSATPKQKPATATGPNSEASETSKQPNQDLAALAPLAPSEATDEPRIDVSRISPDGTSVFAGTARAGEAITLYADGTAIAEATADETGSWSITTGHRFANLDPKLTLERGQHLAKAEPAKPTKTHDEHQKLAAHEATDALKNFEAIVDAARRESAANGSSTGNDGASQDPKRDQLAAAQQTPAASPTAGPATSPKAAPTSPVGDTVSKDSATPSAPNSEPAKSEGVKSAVVKIPVPITFVYNRAELTEEGTYAARLLLDFVKLKGLGSVSLTGHADERGSQAYNYDLSRERLETIAKLLREGGYDGRLKLIPKGKSEPYRGIDRKALSQEALYQADRRVELRYVR